MRAALLDIPGALAPGVGVGYDAGAPRFVPFGVAPGVVAIVQVFQPTMADGASASHPVPQRIDTP